MAEATLRDTLSAAFDEDIEDAEIIVDDKSIVEDNPSVEDKPIVEDKPAVEDKLVVEDKPIVEDKKKVVTKKKDESVEDEEKTEVKLPKSRAPGNWKPVAREKWNAVAPEVQQEVLRREREIANGFNEIAVVKKFHSDFGAVMQQHQAIINAEGGNGMKMTRDLFQTAAALYNGSPQAKAQTVAAMISNFGVDLPLLDSILAGEKPKSGGSGNMDAAAFIRAQVQEAIAPLLHGKDKQVETEVSQDIEAFASDPKNEFFDDLKDTMADLLEVAAKQGKKLTLQDAYKAASMLNTEIADVVNERNLRQKAATNSSLAAQARKRAVSLKTAPSKELASGEDSTVGSNTLRNDIMGAIDSLTE